MGFREKLEEKLKDAVPAQARALLPRGYQQIGHVMLLKLRPELDAYGHVIGEAALSLFPRFSTVCAAGEIRGAFRQPEVRHLAGEKKFEVAYREHGCVFHFDVRKIMWSKGNNAERARIASLPQKGEVVGDFFAGIGYWTVPIARQRRVKSVVAFEWNPDAVQYLEKNVAVNRVDEIVDVVAGDCTQEAPKRGTVFDRIILGLIPAPKFALPSALSCLKSGGMLHYEGTAVEGQPEQLFADVQEAARSAGKKATLVNTQHVKDYAPKVAHYTLDVRVDG